MTAFHLTTNRAGPIRQTGAPRLKPSNDLTSRPTSEAGSSRPSDRCGGRRRAADRGSRRAGRIDGGSVASGGPRAASATLSMYQRRSRSLLGGEPTNPETWTRWARTSGSSGRLSPHQAVAQRDQDGPPAPRALQRTRGRPHAAGPARPGEAHYAIGATFAMALAVTLPWWLEGPALGPALVTGLVTACNRRSASGWRHPRRPIRGAHDAAVCPLRRRSGGLCTLPVPGPDHTPEVMMPRHVLPVALRAASVTGTARAGKAVDRRRRRRPESELHGQVPDARREVV